MSCFAGRSVGCTTQSRTTSKPVCARPLMHTPISGPVAALRCRHSHSSSLLRQGMQVTGCICQPVLSHPVPEQPLRPARRGPHTRHPLIRRAAAGAVDGFSSPQEKPAVVAASVKPAASSAAKKMAVRALVGTVLGLTGALIIAAGGYVYGFWVAVVAALASRELFGFMVGMADEMKPPHPVFGTLLLFSSSTMAFAPAVAQFNVGAVFAIAVFIFCAVQTVIEEQPRFSQLASNLFGLMYTGLMPSFWVQLRMLSVPAIHSSMLQQWPVALGGLVNATVGFCATLTAVACIIAADSGAYFVGKNLGRTQLCKVSPNKTVEGAVGGLVCSVLTALLFWRLLAWPLSMASAIGLGCLVFCSSLFGDLAESVMKREAGMKDSGDLIPGHGGVLDRFDSYMFTGAVVFGYVTFVLPLYGV